MPEETALPPDGAEQGAAEPGSPRLPVQAPLAPEADRSCPAPDQADAQDSIGDDDVIVCVDEEGEFYDLVRELGIGRSRAWMVAAAVILVLAAGAAVAGFIILN